MNFAAGMSGGIAYVWDPRGRFPGRCNLEMVELERLEDAAERREVRRLVERHLEHTGSAVARELLAGWDGAAEAFVKVMPVDYKRVLRTGGGSPEESSSLVEPAADGAGVAAAS